MNCSLNFTHLEVSLLLYLPRLSVYNIAHVLRVPRHRHIPVTGKLQHLETLMLVSDGAHCSQYVNPMDFESEPDLFLAGSWLLNFPALKTVIVKNFDKRVLTSACASG